MREENRRLEKRRETFIVKNNVSLNEKYLTAPFNFLCSTEIGMRSVERVGGKGRGLGDARYLALAAGNFRNNKVSERWDESPAIRDLLPGK